MGYVFSKFLHFGKLKNCDKMRNTEKELWKLIMVNNVKMVNSLIYKTIFFMPYTL